MFVQNRSRYFMGRAKTKTLLKASVITCLIFLALSWSSELEASYISNSTVLKPETQLLHDTSYPADLDGLFVIPLKKRRCKKIAQNRFVSPELNQFWEHKIGSDGRSYCVYRGENSSLSVNQGGEVGLSGMVLNLGYKKCSNIGRYAHPEDDSLVFLGNHFYYTEFRTVNRGRYYWELITFKSGCRVMMIAPHRTWGG